MRVAVARKEEVTDTTSSSSSTTVAPALAEPTTDLSEASDPQSARTILGTITGVINGKEGISCIVREYHEDFTEPSESTAAVE